MICVPYETPASPRITLSSLIIHQLLFQFPLLFWSVFSSASALFPAVAFFLPTAFLVNLAPFWTTCSSPADFLIATLYFPANSLLSCNSSSSWMLIFPLSFNCIPISITALSRHLESKKSLEWQSEMVNSSQDHVWIWVPKCHKTERRKDDIHGFFYIHGICQQAHLGTWVECLLWAVSSPNLLLDSHHICYSIALFGLFFCLVLLTRQVYNVALSLQRYQILHGPSEDTFGLQYISGPEFKTKKQ